MAIVASSLDPGAFRRQRLLPTLPAASIAVRFGAEQRAEPRRLAADAVWRGQPDRASLLNLILSASPRGRAESAHVLSCARKNALKSRFCENEKHISPRATS